MMIQITDTYLCHQTSVRWLTEVCWSLSLVDPENAWFNHFDDFALDYGNSSVLVMKLPQSCTKLSMYLESISKG